MPDKYPVPSQYQLFWLGSVVLKTSFLTRGRAVGWLFCDEMTKIFFHGSVFLFRLILASTTLAPWLDTHPWLGSFPTPGKPATVTHPFKWLALMLEKPLCINYAWMVIYSLTMWLQSPLNPLVWILSWRPPILYNSSTHSFMKYWTRHQRYNKDGWPYLPVEGLW